MELSISKHLVVVSILAFYIHSVASFGNFYWNKTIEDKARERIGLLGDYLGIPPVPGAVSVDPPVPVIVGNNLPKPEIAQIKVENCKCMPSNQCVNPPTDGAGTFDPRVVTRPSQGCAAGESYCCTVAPICGKSSTIPVPGYTPVNGQSQFGDNPWVVIIFATDGAYLGGGTLIDNFNVITAAHKVFNRNSAPSKVRLGEWNLNSDTEPYKYIEIAIESVIIHENFNSGNLQNDIAIIKLVNPIDLSLYPHIKSACLPGQGESTSYVGQRCRIAGFGTDAFGTGSLQTIMKEVDLPVVSGDTCQQKLRSTRLGGGFILNQNSFLCAGGESGKDACTGDGGSPLVCKSTNGLWTAVGLVAWGVGCAAEDVPGVYVNLANYRNWIDSNKKK